jgi:hypothetical protein
MTARPNPPLYASYRDNGDQPYVVVTQPNSSSSYRIVRPVANLEEAEAMLRRLQFTPADGTTFAWSEPAPGDPSNSRDVQVRRRVPGDYRGEVLLDTGLTALVRVQGSDITLHLPRTNTPLDRRQAIELANCLMDAAHAAEKGN